MASLHLSLLLMIATIATPCLAQAPAPAPSNKVNLTQILEKAGQYSTFIKLLASTQVGTQVESQVKSSSEGMTVFAPTDNAFQNLKAGTINDLTSQQQIQLIQNHVLPEFYSMDQFQTVSNPVRTQSTDQEGGVFGLNITATSSSSFNVSTGDVHTVVNNALTQKFPLAVYQVDKVLMPKFGAKESHAESPSPSKHKGSSSNAKAEEADAPSQVNDEKNAGFGVRSMGMGMVFGLGLVTMGLIY